MIYVGFWKEGKQHGLGKIIKLQSNANENDKNIGKLENIRYGMWKHGTRERWYENLNELIAENFTGYNSNFKQRNLGIYIIYIRIP